MILFGSIDQNNWVKKSCVFEVGDHALLYDRREILPVPNINSYSHNKSK